MEPQIIPEFAEILDLDPFSNFLKVFIEAALSPELSLWNDVKSALPRSTSGRDLDIDPTGSFSDLHSFLCSHLLQDYNCRLLLKTAHTDLYKCPSQFPAVFVEHYYFNESLTWCWNRWVVPQWPELEGVTCPEVGVNKDLAEQIAIKLSPVLKVEKVVSKTKWRVAAFKLDPKEVLEKSVKYLLAENEHKIRNSCVQNLRWKVEVAMKPIALRPDIEDNPKNEEMSSASDSPTLLAQCILRLCKMLNYSIDGNTNPESLVSTLGQFLPIPDSVNIPAENILVSFSLSTESGVTENPQRQVLMELNSKEYYSQYSETVVILYNYARVKTILERYDGLVESKEYPEIPPLESVDFNLIGESKDEFPIILMLFMYPRVRQSVINIRRRGKGFDKVNAPFLFDFIKSLARAFDTFYNRNVVIVPVSAPHNFGSMFARLYLLKSIALIFKEFIFITGIEMD